MEKEDSARKSFGGIIGGVTMRQRVVIPTSLAILGVGERLGTAQQNGADLMNA